MTQEVEEEEGDSQDLIARNDVDNLGDEVAQDELGYFVACVHILHTHIASVYILHVEVASVHVLHIEVACVEVLHNEVACVYVLRIKVLWVLWVYVLQA